jgi:hypothetical protein
MTTRLSWKLAFPPSTLSILDYPYWHTIQDTADKVSAESLEIVGKNPLDLGNTTKPTTLIKYRNREGVSHQAGGFTRLKRQNCQIRLSH